MIDVNLFASRLFSVTRQGAIGRKYWEVLPLEERTLGELQQDETLRRSLQVINQAGQRFSVEVFGIIYSEGERPVIQLNVRDVTELARAWDQIPPAT